ncbi:hypothetical protein PVAP13_4KG409001 [Panicum virgatum]|uniref:Uncharacterized protein n=1 Tax=Panicum virgatum TaxID=38727 RepID=A0A8T0TWP0_PANVG|nr:hypothetical protein PVAP13_4KG409001 [Panicum virgatum]
MPWVGGAGRGSEKESVAGWLAGPLALESGPRRLQPPASASFIPASDLRARAEARRACIPCKRQAGPSEMAAGCPLFLSCLLASSPPPANPVGARRPMVAELRRASQRRPRKGGGCAWEGGGDNAGADGRRQRTEKGTAVVGLRGRDEDPMDEIGCTNLKYWRMEDG